MVLTPPSIHPDEPYSHISRNAHSRLAVKLRALPCVPHFPAGVATGSSLGSPLLLPLCLYCIGREGSAPYLVGSALHGAHPLPTPPERLWPGHPGWRESADADCRQHGSRGER